jgi:hypothetical protein
VNEIKASRDTRVEFVAKPTDGRRSAHKPKEETQNKRVGGRKKKKTKTFPVFILGSCQEPPLPYFLFRWIRDGFSKWLPVLRRRGS